MNAGHQFRTADPSGGLGAATHAPSCLPLEGSSKKSYKEITEIFEPLDATEFTAKAVMSHGPRPGYRAAGRFGHRANRCRRSSRQAGL